MTGEFAGVGMMPHAVVRSGTQTWGGPSTSLGVLSLSKEILSEAHDHGSNRRIEDESRGS